MMSDWMNVWDRPFDFDELVCPHCDQERTWGIDENGLKFPDHPLSDYDWVIFSDGVRSCRHCGMVDTNFHPFVCHSVSMETNGKARGREGTGGACPTGKGDWRGWLPGGKFRRESCPIKHPKFAACSAFPERGRYKQKFHYNERVAQWFMLDPDLPEDVWKRLEDEALSGKYGPPDGFTRSTIYLMTKNLGLQKFRERWKSILSRLSGQSFGVIHEEIGWKTTEAMERKFTLLVNQFFLHKETMPKSVIKKKDGSMRQRDRHNFLNYNYVQRKILESEGIWHYHHEFPVPRSHVKLQNLDDIMEKMCRGIGMRFQRSTIIKRPKIKRH